MSTIDITAELARIGAIITNDHFVYTKGGHGRVYVAKGEVLSRSHSTRLVAQAITDRALHQFGQRIAVVAGPAVDGAMLAQAVLQELASHYGQELRLVYTEKTPAGLTLRPGHDRIVHGQDVLIVEDVLNTGTSARMTADRVREAGGLPLGVHAICNRGNVTATMLGVPYLDALFDYPLRMWTPEECRQNGPCAEGVPINTTYGHGRTFLEEQQRIVATPG
ncbi:phosphoribosyltransferase [Candidatus Uhrbacteria bacterium]|nr:phosphoribosyltransferase [Candidatus Uhrbacteria bacterium]